MHIPENFRFTTRELLPKIMVDTLGNSKLLWQFIDQRIINTIHSLRMRYGKMIMNDYEWGGNNEYRGYRPYDCEIGAMFSQHKFGKAADLVPAESDLYIIQQDILADPWHPDFRFITTLELDISWLHIDCRNHDKKIHGVKLIKP